LEDAVLPEFFYDRRVKGAKMLATLVNYMSFEHHNANPSRSNVKVPPWFYAKGRATGLGRRRKYPNWVRTVKEGLILDRYQYEGLDVSLPKVIEDIKKEAHRNIGIDNRAARAPVHNSNIPQPIAELNDDVGINQASNIPQQVAADIKGQVIRKQRADIPQVIADNVAAVESINSVSNKNHAGILRKFFGRSNRIPKEDNNLMERVEI
jgi:hypothetical protein